MRFLTVLLTALLALQTSVAVAEDVLVEADGLSHIELAEELAQYGELNDDPLALIVAASILRSASGGQLSSQPEEAESEGLSQYSLSADDKGKISLTLGEKQQAASARSDFMLDKAAKLGVGDKAIQSLVESARNRQFQFGAVTCYAENDMGAAFWWTAGNRSTARYMVMRACRMNTPVGYRCFHAGCD